MIRTLLARLNASGDIALPTLARFSFAAVLAGYFWASAKTKLDGVLTPSFNSYAQIFPRQMEAAGYDISGFGAFHWLVIMAGSYAEFVLPALIILGLATRVAALGMIGFVAVQTLTDKIGHGADLGAWFDRASDSLIADQRLLWVLLLTTLVLKGAGPLSLDRLIAKRILPPHPSQG
ncbi:MAG: DoxX family protein [Maritimibacter sp.]